MAASKNVLLDSSLSASAEAFSSAIQQSDGLLFSDVENCIRHRLAELQQRRSDQQEEQQQQLQQQRKAKTSSKVVNKDKDVQTMTFRSCLALLLPFAHPALLSHALSRATECLQPAQSKIDNKAVDLEGDTKIECLKILCFASIECLKIVRSSS